MKYRKKPVVIEAFQFTADSVITSNIKYSTPNQRWEVFDKLHDTWIGFELNDWIITGIQGETYPCKPDVFAEMYEPVIA